MEWQPFDKPHTKAGQSGFLLGLLTRRRGDPTEVWLGDFDWIRFYDSRGADGFVSVSLLPQIADHALAVMEQLRETASNDE